MGIDWNVLAHDRHIGIFVKYLVYATVNFFIKPEMVFASLEAGEYG